LRRKRLSFEFDLGKPIYMIVTIDGPAGAGKSSLAKLVAENLGFLCINTGSMYRAIALAGIRADVNWNNKEEVINITKGSCIQLYGDRVFLSGDDVTELIRSPTISDVIKFVADVPETRIILGARQRAIAEGRDVVAEGRDQGTEIFPEADYKIFLTASPLERAKRRQKQLQELGRFEPLDQILQQQNKRDEEDRGRCMGRLAPAGDAVVINSDNLSKEEVLLEVLKIVNRHKSVKSSPAFD
jgi:cytidylate kinase